MRPVLNRRDLLKAIGAPALGAPLSLSVAADPPRFSRMPAEGKDTPKICLGYWGSADDAAALRRLKQIGVDHVLSGGPRIPWDEGDLRARIAAFAAGGLTLCNLMISGFDDVIWGRPGADAQVSDVITSIRAAGRAGLPVVEYNFYAHRLMEGYKEEEGRAGAGYTAYDYELSRHLPPRESVGTHTRAQQVDLYGVMRELVRQKYPRAIYPEHP
jgi:mannonate dehydratase